MCENWLRIGFRNAFLRFTSENKVDLDELYILKITFKNSLESVWGMSHSISHRISSRISCKIFLQEFPTRISHKIFPQDIHARISCKIVPQDFPELDPDWLAPHQPIPNAKFPPITAFLKLAFSPPPCPTRISCKNFPQDFPTRFSRKNFPHDFPARFSHKIFLSWILIGWLPITLFQMLNFHQSLPFLNSLFPLLLVPKEFPARISRKIFPQDFPARISCKIFLSWILIGWLPITLFQMLNFHQSLPFLNWLFPLLLVPQEFPARISHKIFPQDFRARFSQARS